MASYKTKGIVIKRTNFGEADRLLLVFSERHGLIRIIAKGVKKPLSKLAGHIELFCLSDLVIAEGKNIDVLTGAVIEKCFFNLRNNIATAHNAYYLGELIVKMLPENEPHPKAFQLFENVLENIDTFNNRLIIEYFEVNLLSDLGYLPELHKCVHCGNKGESEKNYFSFSGGGLVCESCRKSELKISDEAVKILRLFLNNSVAVVKKLKVNDKIIDEIGKITSNYLKEIHQQEFKSERYLKR